MHHWLTSCCMNAVLHQGPDQYADFGALQAKSCTGMLVVGSHMKLCWLREAWVVVDLAMH